MCYVPIVVDAMIVYEGEYSGKLYFLVARNALYVESVDHNLIPPFILREVGLIVNERPKIHHIEPDMRDKNMTII